MGLVLVGLAALFWLGRSATPRARSQPADGSAGGTVSKVPEAAVLSEGFDYEQQVDGRPVFRLQGERFSTDREGKAALEGVTLRLYREGEPLDVQSRRATYDPESQRARLEGDVRLSNAGGWELETDRLDLLEGGKVVASRGERARFRRGTGISGSAKSLRYESERGELALAGRVDVRGAEAPGAPPLHLLSGRLVWRPEERALVASEDVEMTSGADRVRADAITAYLSAGDDRLESALAEGSATGEFSTAGDQSVAFVAESVELELDVETGAPRASVLRGRDPGSTVRIEISQGGAPPRIVIAPEIRLGWSAGSLSTALASGGVVLEERAAAGAPLRTARARSLTASFAGAPALESARLEGDVELEDGRIAARADSADLERGGSRARLHGDPAVARDERGQISAPLLLYDRDRGQVEATGRVRASFLPSASPLAGGGASAASEPVHVDAEEGRFGVGRRSFSFRGTVQAVQGDSLLFADSFDGDDAAGTATAEGKVRSVWTDRSAAAAPAIATTITADKMVYRREEGEVLYSGAVSMRQLSRELDAASIRVELDAERRARSMTALGAVEIRDREAGRAVAGERADYDLATREAVVTGSPVEIRESSGAVLKGRRALFDLDTGSARLLSESP